MESGVSIKEEYSIQTQSGVDGGYAWVVLFASFFVRSDQKNLYLALNLLEYYFEKL